MGKRKDRESNSEEARLSSPKKKHKHKHKKHKKRKEGEEEVSRRERKKDKTKNKDKEKHHKPEEGSLKIKIKLGGQTLTTKQVPTIVPVVTSEEEDVEIEEVPEETPEISEKSIQQSMEEGSETEEKTKDDVATDNEEEEWLNALEAGELDDYGRLKQEKDISMMTARQRALHGHEIEGENQLLELPTETRRKDEDSEEAQKKRKQRAKKRKQQMQKQIEDNKAQTVKKLLERETTKAKKDEEKARKQKAQKPHVRYLSGKNGFTLSYPEGMDFPLQGQKSSGPVKPKEKCKARGCTNDKKYNCSTNNIPVCSLECYQLVKTLPPVIQQTTV